ncbi:hypothetical protein LOTGIDRAFT_204683 [Lottia gigantea]|uniref:EF-hand domain-containing protein n=1 Tax=Lottia gigantea TaxID=225164 RepID=V3ZVD9_LOTGI|nr:hypothetical protein LOTGIDRAFT_204683 [Lottia gigantea]ESO84881.1 hypothetical protein LOTGIDRAFT_204683 [Lottia gigantea]
MTEQQFRVTEKQIQDAHTTFHLFDHKGNKMVLTKHLGQVFRSLGLHVPDDKVKDWSDEVDEEATGEITFEQFLPLFEMKLKEDEDERELREAFRVLDKNKKGVIDVADLRWLLKSLGDDLTDEEIEAMIIETDTDGSGTVDYEEFKALMTSA